jgi:hypothetical protein
MKERGGRHRWRRLALECAVLAALAGAAGCDLSKHCDPGQVYRDYDCFDVPEAGTDDAAASDGGDDAEASSCSAYQGFGAACSAASQCSCGLDSCDTQPGANYCTHSHCLADPSICPPGWTCFDLSAFDPATGSACLRP